MQVTSSLVTCYTIWLSTLNSFTHFVSYSMYLIFSSLSYHSHSVLLDAIPDTVHAIVMHCTLLPISTFQTVPFLKLSHSLALANFWLTLAQHTKQTERSGCCWLVGRAASGNPTRAYYLRGVEDLSHVEFGLSVTRMSP